MATAEKNALTPRAEFDRRFENGMFNAAARYAEAHVFVLERDLKLGRRPSRELRKEIAEWKGLVREAGNRLYFACLDMNPYMSLSAAIEFELGREKVAESAADAVYDDLKRKYAGWRSGFDGSYGLEQMDIHALAMGLRHRGLIREEVSGVGEVVILRLLNERSSMHDDIVHARITDVIAMVGREFGVNREAVRPWPERYEEADTNGRLSDAAFIAKGHGKKGDGMARSAVRKLIRNELRSGSFSVPYLEHMAKAVGLEGKVPALERHLAHARRAL